MDTIIYVRDKRTRLIHEYRLRGIVKSKLRYAVKQTVAIIDEKLGHKSWNIIRATKSCKHTIQIRWIIISYYLQPLQKHENRTLT